MAEELQALLNRINEEGFKKADDDRQQILKQAEVDAEKIVAEARTEAAHILSEAKQQADLMVSKGEESLHQAARDVLLQLRQRLEVRMKKVVVQALGETLDPNLLADVLKKLIQSFLDKDGNVENAEILLSEQDQQQVKQVMLQKLTDDLRQHCQLAPVADLDNGFKVVFKGKDVMYDFSDQALADALVPLLNASLAEIVRETTETGKQA